MIKQIAVLTKKPGMSRQAFIDRYENGHAPLALEIVPFFSGYRRNYVVDDGTVSPAHIGHAGVQRNFDGISEFWFKDQATVDELMRALAETDAGAKIAEDETHLFDRSKINMFTVDEYVTPQGRLAPRPANHAGRPAMKLICLVKKRAGMSRSEFIEYYENNHVPLALDLQTRKGGITFAEYSRSFPVDEGEAQIPHIEFTRPARNFDVMTVIGLWTPKDYQDFLACWSDPEIGRTIAEDEGKLFDRQSITMFLVNEFETPEHVLKESTAKFRARNGGGNADV